MLPSGSVFVHQCWVKTHVSPLPAPPNSDEAPPIVEAVETFPSAEDRLEGVAGGFLLEAMRS